MRFRGLAAGALLASGLLQVFPSAAQTVAVFSASPSSSPAGGSVLLSAGGAGFDGSASMSLERLLVENSSWTATGSFTQARYYGALTRLADGRALLAGGQTTGPGLHNADIYDPVTSSWTAAAPMIQGRRRHAAILLPDGRVLEAGGADANVVFTTGTEIYDPSANAWTAAAPMSVGRGGHLLVGLRDGRVLAVGGYDGAHALATAEVYDSTANAWSSAGTMSAARIDPIAVVLADGRVLVSGGNNDSSANASADLYDPGTNSWTPTGAMGTPRYGHEAALLPDGRVLVTGGAAGSGPVASAEIYDPASGTWSPTGPLATARYYHGMALVGGAPAIIGGEGTSSALGTTEIYDVSSNTWRAGPNLVGTRDVTYHQTVVLGDGRILAAGGSAGAAGASPLATAELLGGTVTSISASGVAAADAQHASGTFNLAGAATGSWDVVVRESGSRSGRFSGGFLVLPPVAPPPVTLTSISVAPPAATVLPGASQAFSATGHFSDGSSRSFDGSGAWTYGPVMGRARYIASAAYASGRFFVFGGSNNSTPSGSPTTEALDPVAGTWSSVASQPVNRLAAAAAAVGGTVYVAGGCVNSDCSFPTNALWAYDSSSNTWTQKASMPTTRFGPAAAVLGGKVYVAGGDLLGYAATAVFEAYDPATNTWSTKAPLPGPRGFLSLSSYNGKLYAIGGTDNAQGQPFHPRAETFVYDAAADTWTAASPLPEARALAGAVTVDGRIYVVSGQTPGGAQSTTTYVYDPAFDTWSPGPFLHDQRYDPAVAAGGGRIFISGSLTNVDSTSCELLAPGPGVTWSSDAPSVATVAASGLATALSVGTAHIVASSGTVSGSATLTVNPPPSLTSITVSPSSATLISGSSRLFSATGHFSDGSARLLAGEGAWARGPDLTAARYLPSGAFANGKFYEFGGTNTSNKQGLTGGEAYDPASGAWTAIAPQPVRRVGGPAAAVNGIIYVIGGCLNSDCGTPTNQNWAYDTAANTWTQKASMPTVRYGMQVAAVNGKVYVAGGDVPFFAATSVLEVYDPATDTWSTKASMPAPRGWGAAAELNGKLYVAGGTDNASGQPFHPRAETFVYDPATDAWTSGPAMPEPRAVLGGAALDGRMYVMGGQAPGGTISTATFVLDPAAGVWTPGPFLNEVRYQPASGAGAGQVFVAGAISADIDSTSFEILTPGPGVTWTSDAPSVATVAASGLATGLASGSAHIVASSGAVSGSATLTVNAPPTLTSITVSPSSATLTVGSSRLFAATGHFSDGSARLLAGEGAWARGPDMTAARYLPSGAFANGKFYEFGGTNTSNKQGLTGGEAYDPVSGTWTAIAPQPVRRVGGPAVALNGIIYVIGGCLNSDCGSPTGANWAYDTAANTWTQKASVPTVRYGMQVAAVNGKVYVAGGDVPFFAATSVLEVYDPATDAWSTKASMPAPRGWGAAAELNGKLYVVGGTDNASGQPFHPRAETFIYDPATDAWTSGPPMPEPRAVLGGAALDGRMYVMGGQAPAGTISTNTFVYDPAAGAWAPGPFLNEVRYQPSSGAGAGRVFVAGAISADIDSTSFEILTPGPGVTWSSDAPSVATVAASGLATALAAGAAHVVASSGAVTGSAAVFVPASYFAPLAVSAIAPSSAATGTSFPAAVLGDGFDGSAVLRLERPGLAASSWTAAGSFAQARFYGALTKLADGRALLAGGMTTGPGLRDADIFDPATGSWIAAAPMIQGRRRHAAIMLRDGRVLEAGGADASVAFTSGTEIYDPSANAWTAAAPMSHARGGHLLVGLPDGRVLAVGGWDGAHSLATAEIYDSTANAWSPAGTMSAGRIDPTAVVLTNGKVLVSGGNNDSSANASADLYDPAANSWTPTGAMGTPRYGHEAVRLPGGRVLVSGGADGTGPVASAEIYDPSAGTWTPTGALGAPRYYHGMVLAGGAPLLVGGESTSSALAATEIYDLPTNSWRPGPSLLGPRDSTYHQTVLLDDGRVLAAGGAFGATGVTPLATAEVLGGPASVITAAGVSAADAQHLSGSFNLAGAATGYWDVVVRESGGRSGRLPGGFTITTNHSLPVLAGAAVGTSSIAWSWAAVFGQIEYRVLTSTGFDLSGALGASVLGWAETGLGPNAPAARKLSSTDGLSAPSISPVVTIHTLAQPPAGSAAVVLISSAVLSWSANGNPAGTAAMIERSTGAAFAAISSTTGTGFTDPALAACTTYFYRVRYLNGDLVPTAYDATVSARTSAAAPLPPGSLTAQAISGGAIALSWASSPSPYVSGYRLYMSTDVLSYATPYAELPASATSYVTPALSTSTAYRFGLRAYSTCAGADDGNVNVIATVTPQADLSDVKAAIKVPESGKKVSGNRVTVMAEIVGGDARRVSDVRFQYRTAASTFSAWADIPAADVQHPNPAPSAPYFIHWDVTGLANGSYELRAVAELLDSTVDAAPASIVIGVDAVNHDTDETVVGNSQQKSETVYNGAERTVGTADSGSGAVIQVTLPAGVVASSTDTLTLLVNPPGAPPADSSLQSAGQTLQITLGSGQTSLNGTASIVMHYADADGDGVLDGTSFRADKLSIYSYNVASGKWRKESNTVLDRNARTLTATTPHFSLFGLFSPAAAGNLSSALVYPVPWAPNDGDANNGKPFSAGDLTSGVVFDNLTDAVRIQIYSASGSLVWDYSTSASGGRVQWDGRNAAGRDAASGGYLAVITDRGSGAKLVRKIAIIR